VAYIEQLQAEWEGKVMGSIPKKERCSIRGGNFVMGPCDETLISFVQPTGMSRSLQEFMVTDLAKGTDKPKGDTGEDEFFQKRCS